MTGVANIKLVEAHILIYISLTKLEYLKQQVSNLYNYSWGWQLTSLRTPSSFANS